MRARFAGCLLDTESRQMYRQGREVHLSPRAFELLVLLVENRPRALSKAALLEHVWPGVFVTEASLARVVTELRDAVGDDARDPHVIRTVHSFGYSFAADVEEEPASPRPGAAGRAPICRLVYGTSEVALPDGEHVAGREPDASVRLDSTNVSRRHARFIVSGEQLTVEDLGSKNGTFVRGERISTPTMLGHGDEVRIGPFTLTVRIATASGSTVTEGL